MGRRLSLRWIGRPKHYGDNAAHKQNHFRRRAMEVTHATVRY